MSKTIKTAVTNEKETKIAAIAAEAEAKPEATAEAKQSKAKVVKAEPKAEKKVKAEKAPAKEELGSDSEAEAELKKVDTIDEEIIQPTISIVEHRNITVPLTTKQRLANIGWNTLDAACWGLALGIATACGLAIVKKLSDGSSSDVE